MNRQPAQPLTRAQQHRLRKIMVDFHRREFGEELAKINFMPREKRIAELSDMLAHAESKGVKFIREPRGVT